MYMYMHDIMSSYKRRITHHCLYTKDHKVEIKLLKFVFLLNNQLKSGFWLNFDLKLWFWLNNDC